jgi:uncharacterized protein (TIGR03000 family)
MVRHWFSVSAVLALGLIFVGAEAAQAQIFRGRRSGGYRDGPSFSRGYYPPGNGMYYNGPMNRYAEPGTYYNAPMRYGEPGMYYNMMPPSGYMPGQPIQPASYVGQVMPPATSATLAQSYYAAPQQNAVLLDVRVPVEDAEVLIDGTPTRLRGHMRQFYSPPLEPGKTFTYEVTAKFTQDGKPVTRTERQEVRAGERYTIDFTKPHHERP